MIDLGLTRVFRLLARTPLPWRALHVAGTNGKGSICAYISAMLSAYNTSELRIASGKPPLKHGRFTSPHLIDRWDCITINEETVSEAIFKKVESQVLERNRLENIQATEFEILTVTAFEIFTLENVDIGVIEVGMGGRLDATNVLGQEYDGSNSSDNNFRARPLVTGISTIALDHQGFLGNTLTEIATQKAGILKPGVPLVLASNEDSVIQQILSLAKETGVEVFYAKDTEGFDVHRHSTTTDVENVRQQNGAMAYTITTLALQQLHRLPTSLPPELSEAFRKIPISFIWPGRLQDLSIEAITGYKHTVILDGAHNVESATVLANTVHQRAGERSITWVLAASKGKDVDAMFKLFLRPNDDVVATEFGPADGMPWVKATAAEDVGDAAKAVCVDGSVVADPDVTAALKRASEVAEEKDALVVIAGSLYLVSDVLRLVRAHSTKARKEE